jgi:predicted nucleic acid-binding protein
MVTTTGSSAESGVAILLDSNVLVYAVDRREPAKRRVASDLLGRLTHSRQAAGSTQTLGEFFRVATRSIPDPLSAHDAALMVRSLNDLWRMQPITPHTMLEAVRGHLRYGFPYWDAQLWATARLNHVPVVLSEDFADGSEVEGVRFANPFAEGFDLDAILSL